MKYLKRFETADYIVIDDKDVSYDVANAYPFLLSTNDEIVFGDEGGTHGGIMDIKFVWNSVRGRIWIEQRVISFWVIDADNLSSLLKKIQDSFNKPRKNKIDFFDGTWNIDLFRFEMDKTHMITKQKYNKYKNNFGEYELSDESFRGGKKGVLVPLLEYLKDNNQLNIELDEEAYKLHLMNQKDKEEYYKKHKKPKGWGSKSPKSKREWRWALGESVLFFDDYLLLEGRKENLLIKYQSELGDDIGQQLYDCDDTDNKAYIEWLLIFFKNNRKELMVLDNTFDVLKLSIEKYHKNRKNLSKKIETIKTLKELRMLLDEKDNFDTITYNNIGDFYECDKNDVKIWLNSFEWLVFQPYKYILSQKANRKDRHSNWCTTYAEHQFSAHNGEKGGLLYCVNKLDSSKDVAFELIFKDKIKIWDYRDQSTDCNGVDDMKYEFDDDSEIYNLFESNIEENIIVPEITTEELIEKGIDYLDDLGIENMNFNINLYLDCVDETDFMEKYIKQEIEYYKSEIKDLLDSYQSLVIIKWLKDKIGIEYLLDYFNCTIDELDENMDDIDVQDDLISNNDLEYDITSFLIRNRYEGYNSSDLLSEFENVDDMEYDDIKRTLKNYNFDVDVDNIYILKIVERMSRNEMIEMIYN